MISFAQSVREEQGSVKVYFRVSDVRLDEDYNNNGKSLNEFAEIINSLSTNTTQENLSFDLTALGLNFNVVVDITQDGYSLGEVAVNVEGNNIKASLYDGEIAVIDSADLANYNDVSTLLDIVEDN